MGIEVGTALLIASAVGGAAAVGTSVISSKAAKDSNKVAPIANEEVQDEAVVDEDKDTAKRLGRLALIETSPRGALGQAPVGRKSLLSN